MLPEIQYNIAAATLTKAETRIAEIRAYAQSLPKGDLDRKEQTERAERLTRYQARIQGNFDDLHGYTAQIEDASFRDIVAKIITGYDAAQVQKDRAFFGEIHADTKLRHRFFKAMDDLAAANDNPFNPGAMKQIKAALMRYENLSSRTIAAAVSKIDLSHQNVSPEIYMRGLIELLNDATAPKIAHVTFGHAVGPLRPASQYISTYDAAPKLRATA